MKRIVLMTTALGLVAISVVTAGASNGIATARPALKMTGVTPLQVSGTGFRSGERVVIRITGWDSAVKRVSASRRGTFVARFPGILMQRCGRMVIVAVGNRGSRAVLRPSPRWCPPPP